MRKPAPENTSLLVGTASAVGASACCVLPLVLVSLGVGGAWVVQLRALERFFPVFVALVVATFGFAFYRLYLHPVPCGREGTCASPRQVRSRRIMFWIALGFATFLLLFPYIYA